MIKVTKVFSVGNILFILFLFVLSQSKGQTLQVRPVDMDSLMRAYLSEFVDNSGLIGVKKKIKRKRGKLVQSMTRDFTRFNHPGKSQLKIEELVYTNNITDLSRKIFPSSTDNLASLDILDSNEAIKLPVITNISPLSTALDPDASHQFLRVNLNQLIQASSNNSAIANKPFFNLAAKASLDLTKQSHKVFTMAIGNFENRMTEVYERIKEFNLEEGDLIPAMKLWNLYSRGEIDRTYKYIKHFSALAIMEESSTSADLKANLNISGSVNVTTPIFSARSNNKYSFDNESQWINNGALFKIYMYEQPRLANILTEKEIYNAWHKYKFRNNDVYKSSGDAFIRVNEINLKPTETVKIYLNFGPIPSNSVALVNADLPYSLDHFENSAGVSAIGNVVVKHSRAEHVGNGIYRFPVEITRNESFFYSITHNADYQKAGLIRLKLDQGVDLDGSGTEQYLGTEYPVIIKSTTKPHLLSSNSSIVANTNETNYLYSWDVPFIIDFATIVTRDNLRLVDLELPEGFFSELGEQQLFRSLIDWHTITNGNAPNHFIMKLRIPTNVQNHFDQTNNNFLSKLTIEIQNGSPFPLRDFQATFIAPLDTGQINITSGIKVSSAKGLLSVLKQDIELVPEEEYSKSELGNFLSIPVSKVHKIETRIKLSDLLNKENADTTQIINILINVPSIKRSINGEYSISNELIDETKYRTFLNTIRAEL
ncbi:MAG: hypothetical protein RH948_15600 [Cyclobacteriaceae bacterium]